MLRLHFLQLHLHSPTVSFPQYLLTSPQPTLYCLDSSPDFTPPLRTSFCNTSWNMPLNLQNFLHNSLYSLTSTLIHIPQPPSITPAYTHHNHLLPSPLLFSDATMPLFLRPPDLQPGQSNFQPLQPSRHITGIFFLHLANCGNTGVQPLFLSPPFSHYSTLDQW